jgi:hypothetical protein
MNAIETQAQTDFQKSLKRAFWRKTHHWLGRGCNDLLSFNEVFQYLKDRPRTPLGIQSIALEQIVGSSGRSGNFDLAYYPRRSASNERWINVAKAKYMGVKLPPVLLYKVGEAYFVEDGNHRVSVARAKGEKYIWAEVVEIEVFDLSPEPACTRLGYKLNK